MERARSSRMENHGMQNGFEFESLIDALAKRVAAQVRAELTDDSASTFRPRLLTVDQAATYMGRTVEAIQHMVASGKIPTVRLDRRVFIDVRDLERLIEDGKTGAVR
jgi:excisionase family DNA binding protein